MLEGGLCRESERPISCGRQQCAPATPEYRDVQIGKSLRLSKMQGAGLKMAGAMAYAERPLGLRMQAKKHAAR